MKFGNNFLTHRNHARVAAAVLALVTALLVLMPNLVWFAVADNEFFDHSKPYAMMSGILPSVASLLLLFGLLSFRLWIAELILLPFVMLAPVEIAYIASYHEPTWYAIVATIVESNSRESLDFLGPKAWTLLAAILVCAALGIAAVTLLYRTGLAWHGRSHAWGLTTGLCLGVLLVGFAYWHPLKAADPASSANQSVTVSLPSWASSMEPSYPIGMVIRITHYYAGWQMMRGVSARLKDFRFHAAQSSTVKGRQIYVLVLGEASRADRWQLYGYSRTTNPELTAIPDLVRLTDVVTPWDVSRMSVPVIASRKNGNDPRPYFGEPSIARVFAEAGFETYWMSNQLAVGEYDSPISVVAYDAQHLSFHNIADWGNPGNYDEVLLAPLKAAIETDAQKLFVVLHSLGSHASYAYRYPTSFDRFKPSLENNGGADYHRLDLAEEISNSYDSSILYTDHFVAAVIRALEATGAIATMWYIADHGEDLINTNCNLVGHGNGTEYDYRVPSVFWYSKAYASEFAESVAQLRTHATMPLMTENIFESMVDMAAIDFPGHDHSWSVFSTNWEAHPRIVQQPFKVDVDKASISRNCHMFLPR